MKDPKELPALPTPWQWFDDPEGRLAARNNSGQKPISVYSVRDSGTMQVTTDGVAPIEVFAAVAEANLSDARKPAPDTRIRDWGIVRDEIRALAQTPVPGDMIRCPRCSELHRLYLYGKDNRALGFNCGRDRAEIHEDRSVTWVKGGAAERERVLAAQHDGSDGLQPKGIDLVERAEQLAREVAVLKPPTADGRREAQELIALSLHRIAGSLASIEGILGEWELEGIPRRSS